MISCPPLSHNSAVFSSRKSDTLSWYLSSDEFAFYRGYSLRHSQRRKIGVCLDIVKDNLLKRDPFTDIGRSRPFVDLQFPPNVGSQLFNSGGGIGSCAEAEALF